MCSVMTNGSNISLSTDFFSTDIKNNIYIKEEVIIESDDSFIFQTYNSVDHDETSKTPSRNIFYNVFDKNDKSTEKIQQNSPKSEKMQRKKFTKWLGSIFLYCLKCNKSSKVEQREKRIECEDCGTKFLYQCGICKKTYASRVCVSKHLLYSCNKEPSFKCPECNHKSYYKPQLKLHIYSMHTVIDPQNYFKCSKCGKNYKRRIDRNAHEKICGLESYLKCQFCEYKTSNYRYFRVHLMKVHMDIKQEDYHVCHICNRRYKFKQYLATHMRRVHKIGVRLKCAHCSFGTYTKSKLLNHIQRQHHPDTI